MGDPIFYHTVKVEGQNGSAMYGKKMKKQSNEYLKEKLQAKDPQ